MCETLRNGLMLPLGKRQREPLTPAEIRSALVNGECVAAQFNLIAMPGTGLFDTTGDAVLLVIVVCVTAIMQPR